LDFNPIANNDFWGDDYILTNIAIVANFRMRHDMGKMPNFAARSNLAMVVNNGTWMSKKI
jgi:hypothetical protein